MASSPRILKLQEMRAIMFIDWFMQLIRVDVIEIPEIILI